MELATAVVFTTVLLFNQPLLSPMDMVRVCLQIGIFSSLLALFIADIRYGLLPDVLVGSGLVFAGVFVFLFSQQGVLLHLVAAGGAFLFFFLIFLLTRGRGMGFGDVKYAFLMGILLGIPQIVIGLYVAFLTGSVVAIILVVTKKRKFHGGSIPFGPFLILGTVVAFFWGQILWKILLGILGI